MTVADEELESYRRAFASLAEGDTGGDDCPDAERIWQGAHGRLTAREIRELVDHLADCPACAEAWRLAREISDEPVGQAAGPVSRPGSAARWRWLGAAAAAVLLVVVGTQLWRPDSPIDRGGDGQEDALESLLPEEAALDREEALLRWRPGPEGSRYRVEVLTESLDPVATAEDLEAPELLVPEDRLRDLPAGAKLLWRVEAELPTGETLASATHIARLR